MTLTQFVERRIAADFEVVMEDNAPFAQSLDTAHDDRLFELETGNAVGQQPTCTIVSVINMDVITAHAQEFSGG